MEIFLPIAIAGLTDSRAVVLSFSYRFGGEGAGGKQRSTASEDLKGRLK
ncbi:hypothetical protein [Pedobacter sp. NJ-S-72]